VIAVTGRSTRRAVDSRREWKWLPKSSFTAQGVFLRESMSIPVGVRRPAGTWKRSTLSHYPLNGLVHVLAGFPFGRVAAGVI